MSRAPDRSFTLLLLALYAATLHLAVLGLTPLWLDEVQQFGNTRHSTVAELMRWARVDVGASPLPYLLQRAFVTVLGYSAYAARLPAAICSVLCGAVFALLCPRFLTRGRLLALALFLTLPLQFRYGIEARVYSQGLLFSLLALWMFLRLWDRPTAGNAAIYGAIALAGIYSQPLVCFPLLAQAIYALTSPGRRLRWLIWIPTAIAILAFVPWFVAAQIAQRQHLTHTVYFFSLRQIAPQVLLHDLTGGGYATTAALLALALWPPLTRREGDSRGRLLLCILLVSLLGPIVMDAMVQYYFADRQLLFAMPALILLGTRGFERMLDQRQAAIAWALAALFIGSALFKDFHLATIPRDDLDRTAAAIVARLDPGACLLTAPPEQAAYYTFLRPQLETRVCGKDLAFAPEILAVTGPYSGDATRRALVQSMVQSIPPQYRAEPLAPVGQSQLTRYRRP